LPVLRLSAWRLEVRLYIRSSVDVVEGVYVVLDVRAVA